MYNIPHIYLSCLKKSIITLFKHHIAILPKWKQQLISSYLYNHQYKWLAEVIDNYEDIIITTDGRKGRIVSDGDWVFTDSQGDVIVKGHNPDFGNIKGIYSHRSKMFGLLSVFVFVNEYCNYFILLFALDVQYVGDNLGVINKLLNI